MKRIWAGLAMSIALASITAGGIVVGGGGGGTGPPLTDHCFGDPGACGFPDPDYGTVGVPAGTALTPSGAITSTTVGQVIDGLDITTSTSPAINVTTTGVTIKNTRITGNSLGGSPAGANQRLISTCAGCNTLIQDVELTTGTGLYEFAVHGCGGCAPNHSNDTLVRVYQHGAVDMLLWCEGTCSVTDSYSILGKPDGSGGWIPAWTTGLPGGDDHLENLYCNDCTFYADHNTVLNPVPQTGTFFGQVNNGFNSGTLPCENNITYTDSLMAGGGRIFEPCAHAANAGSSNVIFTGNRIARCEQGNEISGGGGTWLCPSLAAHTGSTDGNGYYPNGGSFSVTASYYSAASEWSNNVWDDTGATIPEP